MIPFKSPLQLTVPPTLEKWLDALGALRTLQAQDEELMRQRRAAIAAVRRDVDELQRHFAAFCHHFEIECSELRRLLKYNPDQPRVPAGQSTGGQWTSGNGSGSSGGPETGGGATPHGHPGKGPQYAALDMGTRTDATNAPAGEQYAAVNVKRFDRTGNNFIDGTSVELSTIFASIIVANPRLPGMTPQQYGTFIHLMFKDAVISAQLTGISSADVETTFPEDQLYGSRGSIRTDVILRDTDGTVIAIYDIKTGESGIDPDRANELRIKTGVPSDTPVIEIRMEGILLKVRIAARNMT